ncbi:MAG: flagellar hook-associated protein FlgK [Lachnospiraceae bacterium]|nr:flagellar hook-associated protein FlgK [Lachnospiraceae bacterium]
MSLLTSFNAGVSGLQASQAGINTSAHNLANTKTTGYSRQENILRDTYYNNIRVTSRGIQQIGYGTTVATVRQIRDIFLDKEYRYEVSRQSFYDRQVITAEEIEDILGEMEGVEFQYSMDDIWESLQMLSMDPQSITNRELFISNAESFLKSAIDVYQTLLNYQINLNTEIQSQVDKINSIGEQIYDLNYRIRMAEASGLENANDYRDARNQLMDELAELTYYTYNEDQRGNVLIFIGNAPLVTDVSSYHMGVERIKFEEYNPTTGQYEVTRVSEMYEVVWKDNGYRDVYDMEEAYSTARKTDTGSLLGILTARGNAYANYTDIPVKPEKEDYTNAAGVFDETAYDLAMNKYEDDLKVFNNTTGVSILTRIEAQFDRLIHGIVTMINDAFCPNIEQTLNGVSGVDAKGNTVTLNGKYKILDVVNCPIGTDDPATLGTEVFSRKSVDRYQVITWQSATRAQVYGTDENGNQIPLAQEIENPDGTFTYKLYVYNEEDPDDLNTCYSLMCLEINPKLAEDYALLPVKLNPLLGEQDGYAMQVIEKLLSQWTMEDFAILDPNNETSYSINNYYRFMVTELGAQGDTWKSILANQEKLVEGVEDKRQQVMGVSSEEELVSLLKFQHAYNAASRYITVIDSMLEHLIMRLG